MAGWGWHTLSDERLMLQRSSRSVLRLLRRAAVALLLCSLTSNSLQADTLAERRAHVGLKLFRTFVSADTQLEDKLSPDGQLIVWLVYASNDNRAREFGEVLAGTMSSVRGLPVSIRVRSLEQLALSEEQAAAAIFVAQPLNALEREQVIDYGTVHQALMFSPYDGDVEAGIAGGISVEATVRPAVNLTTLKNSGLNLKSFYLTVAKHYE